MNIDVGLNTTYFLFVLCIEDIHKMMSGFDLKHFSQI